MTTDWKSVSPGAMPIFPFHSLDPRSVTEVGSSSERELVGVVGDHVDAGADADPIAGGRAQSPIGLGQRRPFDGREEVLDLEQRSAGVFSE